MFAPLSKLFPFKSWAYSMLKTMLGNISLCAFLVTSFFRLSSLCKSYFWNAYTYPDTKLNVSNKKLYEIRESHLYASHGTKPSKGGHPPLKTVNECSITNNAISIGRMKDTSSRFFRCVFFDNLSNIYVMSITLFYIISLPNLIASEALSRF